MNSNENDGKKMEIEWFSLSGRRRGNSETKAGEGKKGGAVKNPPRSSVKITFKIPQEEVCKLRAKRTRQR